MLPQDRRPPETTEFAPLEMPQETVPLEVQELLEARQLNGVPVLFSVTSDLSLAGELRRHWLVATRDNLAVVATGGPPELVAHYPLASVDKFRAHGGLGSGLLQASIDGAWCDVARYSNALAGRFHRVAQRLEQVRTDSTDEPEPLEDAEANHCPRCGLRLPNRGESCPRCLPWRAIVGRLAEILLPQWRTALAMSALMTVGVAMELVPPKLQQYLVDDILADGSAPPRADSLGAALVVVVLALAATRVLLGVVNWLKGRLSTRVGVELTFNLRGQLVKKLQRLGVGYYDRHQVGALMSRVAYDSEVLHSLLQQITGGFLLQIIQVVAVGAMLFTLNPHLAILTLLPAPLVVAGSLYFWKRVYPKYYRYWDATNKQAGALSGMLAGIRVVKAFAQEDREYDRFHRNSSQLRASRVTVDTATSTYSAAMQLIFSLGGLIVWYVGGRSVLDDEMTLGSLMAFLAYLAMFYAPLTTLTQLTTWLTSFFTGCQRVFELLDTPLETVDAPQPRSLAAPRGAIEFDKVSFGYERHRPVLREVSFSIRPGERIGIVGRSGSGKTTLVNLLSRFYDVDRGQVRLDGVDVRELPSDELRRLVGVVLQEPFLFRGTILENLVYGRPEAAAAEAIRAARAAQAHDFILAKPLGYDTWIGERGAGLSGGERQRVSIARALLYDPKVLILDEATSSVDTESEKSIQEALRVLTRGRTTLAIAHRLSTLRDSDRILVFDQGQLIEQGTHDELLSLDGQYARLVKIQTSVARDRQLEALLSAPPEAAVATLESADHSGPHDTNAYENGADEPADVSPRWLVAGDVLFSEGPHGVMQLELDGALYRGVFAVACLPATLPADFISLRVCDDDGREQELGILRHLDQWPAAAQHLVRASLAKRSFLRTIESIDSLTLEQGYLFFCVQTAQGPAHFTMRWTQNQAQDFGPRGKMLIDLDDNRFLVPDVSALPPRDRELLERFIYW